MNQWMGSLVHTLRFQLLFSEWNLVATIIGGDICLIFLFGVVEESYKLLYK